MIFGLVLVVGVAATVSGFIWLVNHSVLGPFRWPWQHDLDQDEAA